MEPLWVETIEKTCGAVVLYRIVLSDGSDTTVHSGTVRRLGLKPGTAVAEAFGQAVMESETVEARESALRSLTARGRTAAELTRLLTQKGFDRPVVKRVTDWLAEKGLIEEAQLLEDTAEALLARKGVRSARQTLLLRGFSKEETERVLREKAGDDAHYEGALAQARRKYPELRRRYPSDWAPRLGAWLYGRGYEGQLVRRVLQALKAPADSGEAF